MSEQNSKVAIVTGASRGIGAAIAQRLASDGFTVIVNYAGSAGAAQNVVQEIEKKGGRAIAAQADVADSDAVKRMFDSAEAAFGSVDVLVNNAGIMENTPLAETSDESFDRQIAINLKGTFNGLREAAKRLRTGGRIVNFSSSVVGIYQPNYAVYAATKSAVEAMTHVLAKEMRGRSVTVNSIAPGPIGTELFFNGKSQPVIDAAAKLAPLERLGQPADIAAIVSFLAGPDGAWINGQNLRANGGQI